jgi:internalin A
MTNTPTWALEKIQEAKQKQLKELDLSSNWDMPDRQKLTSVPAEVFELEHLRTLNLSGNYLIEVPKSILKLSNLTSLDLSDNGFEFLPEVVVQLQSLRVLDLSHNQLKCISSAIAQLRNLRSLDLGDTGLSIVPEWIAQLQNLRSLDLGYNRLTTVVNAIAQLQNLTQLQLCNNHLQFIPDPIYELRSLKVLDFRNVITLSSEQNRIEEISSKVLQLEDLEGLYLGGNSIKAPPPEVVNKGLKAIKNYFRQLEAEGKDYLYEAKMLIVGEGAAGKTTLAKKIENPNYQLREDEISTEGIDVTQWNFFMDSGQTFRVNIWDFGGQEIYHATHQFFLTKRSLYTLVADTRKEDTDFYYWLHIIELLSENSPLLIIKNEKQDRQREINERQLRGQFENLKETLATNLATNKGLTKILEAIKHHVSQLPHIGSPLPKTWVKVREALEKDPRNYIRLDEYLDLCKENGFRQPKDSLQLISYLHDLGVCLHFREDPLLKRTIILKPNWGTDAAYKVLDSPIVIRNLGRFTRADLANIWSESKYSNRQDELLQLMINFKLCYQLPDSRDTYIAPQLLTEDQPRYDWHETDNLIRRYAYEFMPKGILTQFIVAMHSLIASQKLVWKSGIVLEKDGTRAEVIGYYHKREIKIRVAGMRKNEVMTIVTYELDKIHKTYQRLKYSTLIPCNCPTCKDSQEPYFYPYEELRDFQENGKNEIQCRKKPYEMVNVMKLIDDVIDRTQFAKEELKLPSGNATIQQSQSGDNTMAKKPEEKLVIRSAWANGSFYLFAFVIVIGGLVVLAKNVSPFVLPLILIAGIIFVPTIGALQLKQDDRLSDKNFIELMKLAIGQLPLIGKFIKEKRDL